MNVFQVFTAHVRAAVETIAKSGAFKSPPDLSRIVVEPPREASHGDLATNAAMALAKDVGMKPRDLAEKIAAELKKLPEVTKTEIAGPGFINLTLDPKVWRDALASAVADGPDFGRSFIGKAEPVNVEYVSANPTGPMHIGHCRGAVFGDALANLLSFASYGVTREYYVNDAGAQVDVLARSAFLRYREALGETIGEIPEGLYPGDYLKECGGELVRDYGQQLKEMPESEWLPIVRKRAIDMMMAEIRNDLAALGVVHDVFFSERTLVEGMPPQVVFPMPGEAFKPVEVKPPVDLVGQTIEELRAKGKVYEGRLPPPKGAPVDDYEDREQTLFRSTEFGDDVDRPLKKSDGTYTYFASDIAYHKSKFDRGFANMIDVWGADHGGYVKRMEAAVAAVSSGKAVLDVKLIQLVRLLRNGEPIKMSKRSGELVLSRDVVGEVGKSAVRFMMLYRRNNDALDFDLAKVIEQSKDNPVFYVQYGHARGHSIFRNAAEAISDLPKEAADRAAFLNGVSLKRLDDAGELSLMRKIAVYPRLIEAAALAHEPHRVAFYLYELASEFHTQWTRGSDAPHLRFIIADDRELTLARLALVQGAVTVLASGLALLGVEAPVEMR